MLIAYPVLFDPKVNAIGIAHAGRIGTLNRIAADCIEAMKVNYGSLPGDILAGIGPSIVRIIMKCRGCYSAGEICFEDLDDILIRTKDGKTYLDLWEANRRILQESGVEKIETAECVLPVIRMIGFPIGLNLGKPEDSDHY